MGVTNRAVEEAMQKRDWGADIADWTALERRLAALRAGIAELERGIRELETRMRTGNWTLSRIPCRSARGTGKGTRRAQNPPPRAERTDDKEHAT